MTDNNSYGYGHVPIEEARRRARGKGKAKGANSHDRDRPRFPLVRFDKIALGTDPNYLVKGLIPRDGLVVVWGPPKCGKSFWTLDLVMHVALGWEYRGRRVQQGTAVYVSCEGERGLAARVEAFRRARMSEEHQDPPFYLLTTRLDLVGEAQALIDDIEAQVEDHTLSVIVIDTLNRSIRGSESNDEDMSNYVKAADLIREKFKCVVVIIHHCGVDDHRPRGHTSLTGAADAQNAVKRNPAGQITTTLEWMKDGPEGEETCSKLEVIEVGTDEDGEPITSCYVVPEDAATAGAAKRSAAKVTGATKVALDMLRKAIEESDEQPPASNHIPASVRAIRTETWRRHCYLGAISEGETQQAKQKSFKRAADKLQGAGIIGAWNEWVWLVST